MEDREFRIPRDASQFAGGLLNGVYAFLPRRVAVDDSGVTVRGPFRTKRYFWEQIRSAEAMPMTGPGREGYVCLALKLRDGRVVRLADVFAGPSRRWAIEAIANHINSAGGAVSTSGYRALIGLSRCPTHGLVEADGQTCPVIVRRTFGGQEVAIVCGEQLSPG